MMYRKFNWKIASFIGGFFLLNTALNIAMADTLTMMGARLSALQNHVRIVFEFNKTFSYTSILLNNPERLVVDLPEAKLDTNLQELPLGRQSLIKDVRHAPYQPNVLRIVFDLNTNTKVNSFILKPSGEYGDRLVIDISSVTVLRGLRSQPRLWGAAHFVRSAATGARSEVSGTATILGKDIIVVIDPGHGGKDPGATGPRGIHEKNIVLAISKAIAKDINDIPGMTTKLTRNGDYFITLRERLHVARKDHADFFVAIHADAFKNRRARGASVFALSQRGATSEAARWLAEKENYSELGGVDLTNTSKVLRSVLIDLSQTATISQSLNIGSLITDTIAKISPMHSRHVEQARFVVLKSPDIPTLLIETGFITNSQEEKRLSNSYYQKVLAAAITSGIKDYFMKYPPPNTLFAAQKYAKRYVVRRADTLASIAERYYVSSRLLMQLNHLTFGIVHPGQTILVPTNLDES